MVPSCARARIGRLSARSLSDQARYELDQISAVVKCFVVDWTSACRIGSSFNAKNRAPWLHF